MDTLQFAAAARRALMLYIPFRDLGHLSDVRVLNDPTAESESYDPNAPLEINNAR
jgi:hypothetical protein